MYGYTGYIYKNAVFFVKLDDSFFFSCNQISLLLLKVGIDKHSCLGEQKLCLSDYMKIEKTLSAMWKILFWDKALMGSYQF